MYRTILRSLVTVLRIYYGKLLCHDRTSSGGDDFQCLGLCANNLGRSIGFSLTSLGGYMCANGRQHYQTTMNGRHQQLPSLCFLHRTRRGPTHLLNRRMVRASHGTRNHFTGGRIFLDNRSLCGCRTWLGN